MKITATSPDREDIRAKYQRRLGAEFGTVFTGVKNQWCRGWIRLHVIRELFDDRDNLKLLNAVTGGVFLWDVQQLMLDDLMMCMTRLTDEPKLGKKKNLTVQRLPGLCEDPDLRSIVEHLVNIAVQTAEPARKYRNKRISHIDLVLERSQQAAPVQRASLNEAEAVLNAVHGVLNAIEKHFLMAELLNFVVTPPERAKAFIDNSKHLVNAIEIVGSLIDPTGKREGSITEMIDAFLKKIDRPLNWENRNEIGRLRAVGDRLKNAQK